MKNELLKYKGYEGSIIASIEDECIYGRILHIDDVVSYEAQTVLELKVEFENAVERYLMTCKEFGKKPDKPYSGVFQVRLTPELHKEIAHKAASQKTSLNNLMVLAVELMLKNATVEVHHTHDHNHIHTVKVEDVQISASMQPTWSKIYASTTQSIQ